MVLGPTCTTRYFSLDTSRYFLFWPSYDSVRWTTLIFFNHYKNSPIRNLNIVTIHCILMCVLSAFFFVRLSLWQVCHVPTFKFLPCCPMKHNLIPSSACQCVHLFFSRTRKRAVCDCVNRKKRCLCAVSPCT